MSAATIISQAFGEDANLYTTVLGLDNQTPTQSQLRKAYYRRALIFHPDKQKQKSNDEKEDAKRKFHAISLAYSILSDEEKRKEYDDCGELNDDDGGDDDFGKGDRTGTDMWKDFFTSTFGKVTTKDIDEFAQSYKCSEEEEKDVLKYYSMFKGNLDKMLECVMCSDEIDKNRWVEDYINPAIKNGSVDDYSNTIQKTLKTAASAKKIKKNAKEKNASKRKVKNNKKDVENDEKENDTEQDESYEDDESLDDDSFDIAADQASDEDKTETEEDSENSFNRKESSTSTSNRLKKSSNSTASKKGAKDANKRVKKQKGGSDDDLISAIRGNAVARRGGEEAFGSFMDSLEQRYASSKSKNKRKNKKVVPPSDISDDEFEKIQARLLKKKK